MKSEGILWSVTKNTCSIISWNNGAGERLAFSPYYEEDLTELPEGNDQY